MCSKSSRNNSHSRMEQNNFKKVGTCPALLVWSAANSGVRCVEFRLYATYTEIFAADRSCKLIKKRLHIYFCTRWTQRFEGYCYKSDISLFAWRFTFNYANSPFNFMWWKVFLKQIIFNINNLIYDFVKLMCKIFLNKDCKNNSQNCSKRIQQYRWTLKT